MSFTSCCSQEFETQKKAFSHLNSKKTLGFFSKFVMDYLIRHSTTKHKIINKVTACHTFFGLYAYRLLCIFADMHMIILFGKYGP